MGVFGHRSSKNREKPGLFDVFLFTSPHPSRIIESESGRLIPRNTAPAHLFDGAPWVVPFGGAIRGE
jgi:hypothetical protein